MFNKMRNSWSGHALAPSSFIRIFHCPNLIDLLCLYLHLVAQLFQDIHVVVYQSDCPYLPYSIHFSEFMSTFCHTKTDKTQTSLKSAIFVSYENGHRQLLRKQSINTERPSLILEKNKQTNSALY